MGGVTCCYKCKERELGCHSKCEKYISEIERAKAIKEIEKKERENGRASRDAVLWNHISLKGRCNKR